MDSPNPASGSSGKFSGRPGGRPAPKGKGKGGKGGKGGKPGPAKTKHSRPGKPGGLHIRTKPAKPPGTPLYGPDGKLLPPQKNPTENPSIRARPAFRPGLDAVRDVVMDHLTRQVERYPNFDLRPLRDDGMEPRDAALAHAIVDATMRRWLTLGAIIERASGRPIAGMQPPLQAALLAATTQMLLLDSIPPYAAINHAVEWLKVAISVGAGGMANAVLRKISTLKDQLSKPEPGTWPGDAASIPLTDCTHLKMPMEILPELAAQRLAVAVSVPMAMMRRWIERWGPERATAVALHALARPPIVLNCAHAVGPIDTSMLVDGGVLLPHAVKGSFVFSGTRDDLRDLLSQRSDIWVQDTASRMAVEVAATKLAETIDPKSVKLVVDVCAGHGTKTRQLAALYPNARIVAADPDERRLGIMRSALRDIPQIHTVRDDQLDDTVRAEAKAMHLRGADVVLLDVPCSNSGVLARRPEAKYRLSAQTLGSLSELQRTIITRGRTMMGDNKNAALIYCTCSLEDEENTEQVVDTEKRLGLRAILQQQHLPTGLGSDAPDRGITYGDGSFVTLMR